MDILTAVGMAEGFIEADSEEEYLAAWQYLVDSRLAWSLPGWFGRRALALIADGTIMGPACDHNWQTTARCTKCGEERA